MLQRHQRFAAVLSCLADAAASTKETGKHRHVALLQLLGKGNAQPKSLEIVWGSKNMGKWSQVDDICIFLLGGGNKRK